MNSKDSLTILVLLVFIGVIFCPFDFPSQRVSASHFDWSIETVDGGESASTGRHTSIVVDSYGNPHISYLNLTGADLMYATKSGGQWEIEALDTDTVGWWTSIALDANGNPHISYVDHKNGYLKYATKTPASPPTIDIVDQPYNTWETSIAIDKTGRPHIAYIAVPSIGADEIVKYAVKDGNTWRIEEGFNSTSHGTGVSLVLDSNDHPHVVFESTPGTLSHTFNESGTWSLETVIQATILDLYHSLAIDSQDGLHMSYVDLDVGVKYAVRKGGVWSNETVGYPSIGTHNDIAVDYLDTPHLCYYNRSDDDLIYITKLSGVWIHENVDLVGGVGGWCSIAIDQSGLPHISYFDYTNGNLKYAYVEGEGPPLPRPPTNLRAILSGKDFQNVTLTWDLSPDDGGGANSVMAYEIHRNTSFDPHGRGYILHDSVPAGRSAYIDVFAGEGDPADYFYAICAVGASNNSSCSPTQLGKFIRPLSKGPNLVSIPLVQSNESIETVLQTVNYDKAWYYDSFSGEWESYMRFKPYDTLNQIDHTMGVWVNATENSDLAVAGIIPAQTMIHLYAGWNLVGFPSYDSACKVADLKAGITATRVEGFDSFSPPFYLQMLEDNDTLEPGLGYWIRVDSESDWIVAFS